MVPFNTISGLYPWFERYKLTWEMINSKTNLKSRDYSAINWNKSTINPSEHFWGTWLRWEMLPVDRNRENWLFSCEKKYFNKNGKKLRESSVNESSTHSLTEAYVSQARQASTNQRRARVWRSARVTWRGTFCLIVAILSGFGFTVSGIQRNRENTEKNMAYNFTDKENILELYQFTISKKKFFL